MTLSLFSISYAGLWGQHRLSLDEFVGRAAALGFEGVMIAGKRPHLSPLEVDPERLQVLRARLADQGLGCTVIAAYTDFGLIGAAEVPWLEFQVRYLQTLSEIAACLGCRCVRVFTGYQPAGSSLTETWSRVVTGLREAADRAAEQDVLLAVQNHHDVAVQTEAMLELLSDIDRPNVRLGFDAWSPALRGEDLYQAALKAAPHTAITTNADYLRLPQFRYRPELTNYEPAGPDLVRAVPFGEGFIDYEAFFSGLTDGGFDGIATYEMCSPLRGGGSEENLDRCAARYLEWMREKVL